MRSYLTIKERVVTSFEVSHSEFICTLIPVESLSEGLDCVREVRKKYSDATHNCYAIVGLPESNEFKFSDDGEPSGTAGQPMLQVLTKNELYGVAAIVTRYFGGIKLGAGGLVQAYSRAVAESVAKATVKEMIYSEVYSVTLGYGEYKGYCSLCSRIGVSVSDVAYADAIDLTVCLPTDLSQTFRQKTEEFMRGEKRYALIESRYAEY